MSIHFDHVCLIVHDVSRAVAFYRDLLGLKVRDGWPYEEGSPYAVLNGISLWEQRMAEECMGGLKSDRAKERFCNRVDICFFSDHVEEDYQRVLAFGVEMVHPLKEEPWGQKVFRFRDPDGNIVEIGSFVSSPG